MERMGNIVTIVNLGLSPMSHSLMATSPHSREHVDVVPREKGVVELEHVSVLQVDLGEPIKVQLAMKRPPISQPELSWHDDVAKVLEVRNYKADAVFVPMNHVMIFRIG